MGKHHESGQVIDLVLTRKFGRVLSACLLAVLVVLAFGFQGPGLGGPGSNASLAMGQVEPGMLPTDGATASAQETAPQSPASAPVVAADKATVSFERSPVQTLDKNGIGTLNVASSSLDRPPAGKLYAPLEVLVPSSPFGLRIDPITGLPGEFHWGQDFAAACGTLVYAADSGVVRAVGWHPWGGGNRVEIDHGNGLVTTYNHLQGIAVTKGQSVRVGEVIARVGTTGSSTGCHLHFETILNGVYTNPMNWTFLPTKQVDPLGDIAMVSYQPGSATATSAGSVWSIPGAVPTDPGAVAAGPAVTGGVQEAKVAPSPAATATQSPTSTASPTGTPTKSPTPTPTGTPTKSPTPTPSPSGTPSPSPAPIRTQTPTGTPPPTATVPPTVTAPPTAAPTSSLPASVPTVPAPSAPTSPAPSAPTSPAPSAPTSPAPSATPTTKTAVPKP
ncbi:MULTISPECIES: peptidoglycan DD-metalloendopeptidase family protein [unclassified Arthrobacter]|uniref:peptidoglycan DD-metalloendopeptidase family protein n=1 Tax=unclassified Arthrobacter TaxID=235627 RepID=UPI002227FCBB|nr:MULTISPECIES: peptidoglycan DD-metalloendopeptidase family protein [unclassified Arthrobacter]UYY81842.1 peptidoglycan DD-metalloendopeptidase family protein [Arthrobacter sp. YA7-1]